MVFNFTIDSSGQPDAIRIPSDVTYVGKDLELRPPAGHAWTYYPPDQFSVGIPLGPDEPKKLHRRRDQAPFIANELVGYGALDTGSGSGVANLE